MGGVDCRLPDVADMVEKRNNKRGEAVKRDRDGYVKRDGVCAKDGWNARHCALFGYESPSTVGDM